MRTDIESQCLRRAIAAGDITWEERVLSSHHRLARTPERVADDPNRLSDVWLETHTSFHRVLLAACDSPCLLEIREMLYARSERYRRLSVPLAREQRNMAQEHLEIMEATLARNPDRAVALLAAHLQKTYVILRDAHAAQGITDT